MPLRLDDLVPNEGAHKRRKRLGRGHGSGRGTYAGRGVKGQKARAGGKARPGFEGGQLPIQQAMPYKRGFTNIYKTPWEVVNLARLDELGLEGDVTPEVLYAHRVIRGLEFPVKILGVGSLTRAVTVHAHAFSGTARAGIEAAGGAAETLERTDRWITARPRSRRLPLNSAMKKARVGKVGGQSRAEAVRGAKES